MIESFDQIVCLMILGGFIAVAIIRAIKGND